MHKISPMTAAVAEASMTLAAAASGRSNEALVLAIARVTHEVNADYCRSLGDFSQTSWETAPQWQKDSAMLGVRMHLANPTATPADSHASWMAQKEKDGWVYGPVKDAEKKEHPCMVAYDELPQEQRSKDYIFRGIIHAIAREQART